MGEATTAFDKGAFDKADFDRADFDRDDSQRELPVVPQGPVRRRRDDAARHLWPAWLPVF